MRTIVFGDIHGGLRGLQQLIERIQLKSSDQLVFLGDYVDGWSESAQVLDELIAIHTKYNCVFIKGNHDMWCEDWLRSGNKDQTWLENGGVSTVNSYKEYNSEQKRKHLELFDEMKSYFIDQQNRLYIHAGFTSTAGPQYEQLPFQLSIDRSLWETAMATDERLLRDDVRYPERLKLFSEIFIGHTPTIKFNAFKPMNAQNVWNVDTGAAFTGKLSAIDVQTKEVWQSDNLQSLYPNEEGRN